MPVEWTDPKTWIIEELFRAADLNTFVRDNLLYLFDPPRAAMRVTGAQEVANATDHTITWDEAVWDSHGDMWDVGAPSKVTITRAGVYAVSIDTLWEDSADAGKRAAFLHVNGNRRRGIQVPAVSPAEVGRTWYTNLGALDEIDFRVRQLSGAALDLQPLRTVATVMWVAAPPVSGE